jgi:hypothetical protein
VAFWNDRLLIAIEWAFHPQIHDRSQTLQSWELISCKISSK